jgi:hypothetical protein
MRTTKMMIFLLLVAASSPSYAVRPRAATPEEAKYFSLDQDVVIQKLRPAKNITFAKCVYRLTFIDDSGEYYTGDEGCFRLVNWQNDGNSQNGQGGIWMPKSPNKAPRAYMVVGTDAATCDKLGLALCRLSMLEDGRFKLMPGKAEIEAVAQIKIVSGTP